MTYITDYTLKFLVKLRAKTLLILCINPLMYNILSATFIHIAHDVTYIIDCTILVTYITNYRLYLHAYMYDTLTVANIAHYWLPLLLTITNTTH